MRYKGLVALSVVAVLGFAAATLPASVLGGMVERYGMQASRWTGTVWAGGASDVMHNGTSLGAARWTLSPWSLLTGRLGGHAELTPPDGTANTDFTLGLGGRTELANVHADVPVAWLNALTKARLRGWNGRVSVRLDSLELDHGWPVAAQGSVALDELTAARGGRVGSYELVFPAATSGHGLRGRLADTDGPLAVTGELALGADRSFDLQGFVTKRGAERTPFDDAIRLLGSPDESGRRPFGLSGTL